MFDAEKQIKLSNESLKGIDPSELIDLVEPKLKYHQSLDSLRERLEANDPLKVKLGIDPTGPDVHLGHIVPLRVLDLFGRAGHDIDLIFGDFTAKIGDPSGRDTARKVLTDPEIAANVASYQDQVHPYFDTEAENVRLHRNSTWLGAMALSDTFHYLQMVNLTEATQRTDFRERMQKGSAVTLAEAMYGTLQGIDSVELHSDVELGGIDQLLNVSQARAVQRSQGQTPEEILLTPIIEGTDGTGRKMSKSYNNYIPATADADEIFGKIMSIPDELIVPYIVAFAQVSGSEIEALQKSVQQFPHEMKKQLGVYLAATRSGNLDVAQQAREDFERKFSRRQLAETDSKEIKSSANDTLVATLMKSGDFTSNSELRRLAQGGGIKVDGVKITEEALYQPVQDEQHITVGKRRSFKVALRTE